MERASAHQGTFAWRVDTGRCQQEKARLRDQEGRGNGIVNLCVRRLEGNGEEQFTGGTHAMGYPVVPVGVGYDCEEIGSALIPKEKQDPDTLSPLSLSNPFFQGILSSI
ncbi:hypothetical protein FCM35_KLT11202 [Carex littledalei]|uniref:Uncharacterized protein n=1 Tax=Carex littledalei TaxID=544730 RepID=A0A833QDZ1_9POAL|nr:hypothetical protein FCM35_KLT11202 [Carex littledalei]